MVILAKRYGNAFCMLAEIQVHNRIFVIRNSKIDCEIPSKLICYKRQCKNANILLQVNSRIIDD